MEIDQVDYVCSLFIDLTTAFNPVDHKNLIEKLIFMIFFGISNEWFQSYLAKREQLFSLNNSKSSRLKVLCGIPQESTLGLLHF